MVTELKMQPYFRCIQLVSRYIIIQGERQCDDKENVKKTKTMHSTRERATRIPLVMYVKLHSFNSNITTTIETFPWWP